MHAEFALQFDGATADLSCGFDRDGANQFLIEGTDGAIRIDAPFIKAKRLVQFTPKAFAAARHSEPGRRGIFAKVADRLPLPGRRFEHFSFPGNGLQFEAAAVMEAVRRGETQSELMPLDESKAVLEIIGLVLSGPSRSA